MPRPKKCRRVSCMPSNDSFGPIGTCRGQCEVINMTVDEFEVIRLIDVERMEQGACAEQMGVSRTTVQGIYDTARHKLGLALVAGKHLHIDGGNYEICGHTHSSDECGGRCFHTDGGEPHCHRRCCNKEE